MMQRFRSTLIVLALLAFAAHAHGAPRILVTIQPLHGLVAGVAGERADPYLLMASGQSPHTYSFSPSSARELHNADVIFAAGDTVERFLERPLQGVSESTRVVWMMELDGITLLDTRTGGSWPHHHHSHDDGHDDDHGHGHDDDHGHGHDDDHGHGHDDDHGHGHDDDHGHGHDDDHGHGHDDDHGHGHDDDHGHGHAHGEQDGHLWLSPDNAITFTYAVAEVLSELDPDHAATYERNAEQQVARIQELDEQLAERLSNLRGVRYFVFHDAYQYFEAHYGLSAAGSVTVDPERPPGARRLREMRERIENEDVQCIYSEPQFEPRVVQAIVHETGIGTGVLDPLGADIEPGADAWFQLMEGLADGLEACLVPS